MASTAWSNDEIDRIFDAVTAAIFDAGPIDNVVSAINDANISSVWPEVVYQDVLDAEYLEP